MTDASFPVALPAGEVVVGAVWTAAGSAEATAPVVLLAPGAGAGFDHPFLIGLADALADAGIPSLRFDFPYRAQGRRMPGPVGHATTAWAAAVAVATAASPGAPLVAAGKSYGGRMASMAAAGGVITPAALVYLGHPLHPPGRPDALRVAHLPDIVAPQLFVTGRTDPFVDPHDQLERAVRSCRAAQLMWVDGNHSFEVRGARRPADAIGAGLAPTLRAWLDGILPA